MVSMSDRARDLERDLLSRVSDVTWTTPWDLARRAMENRAREAQPGRVLFSSGTIHLAGAGVMGSAARMAAVAEIMLGFQRLVTALGASQEGYKSVRGPLPAFVTAKTCLRLVASPYPGSLVLDLMPEMAPGEELHPGGKVALMGEDGRQRVDESVEGALQLLESARSLGPDADAEPLLDSVAAYGPRVASTLRDFTKSLSAADFDADLTWHEPGRPSLRAVLPAADAYRIAELIRTRELDHGEAIIEGVIHTVSDRTALAVMLDDGSYEYVKSGKLSADELQAVAWGRRVRVTADAVEEKKPGGESAARYTAKRIEVI